MTDCKAIAQTILDLPSDLSELERDKRVLALRKRLTDDERLEVALQGDRLLKDRDPTWKRWAEAEELVLFDPAAKYIGVLCASGQAPAPGSSFDPFGAKEHKILRREAERGNEDAARVLAVLALLEEEEIGA